MGVVIVCATKAINNTTLQNSNSISTLDPFLENNWNKMLFHLSSSFNDSSEDREDSGYKPSRNLLQKLVVMQTTCFWYVQ